ncbi:MAG: hypothetical protein ACMXX7_01140 [Candidatus Woesearchaeota archaeon]
MKLNNHKKGQAAVEFLTTYGWALAVILVMISAMSFFGVTSPDRFVNERCIAPTGFVCEDFQITSSNVQLRFRNNLGHDITILYANNAIAGVPVLYTDSGIILRGGTWHQGNYWNHYEGSLSANTASNSLFGRDLFQINMGAKPHDTQVVLEQGSLEKVYVDVYYYRTRSGINFNRVATFELIGQVR